jgi:exosortase
MKQQKAKQFMGRLLRDAVKTPHNCLVAAGLLVGLCFLPFWLADIVIGTMHGADSLLLVAVLGFGVYQLWRDRHQLADLAASEEDRWLGHLLIIAGIVSFPFCFSAEWSQRLIWMVILVGIAISSWGIQFFRAFAIPVVLIGMGLFPKPGDFGEFVWKALLPPKILERLMAWAGTLGLQAIGQPATTVGTVISLPGGSVDVAWGCNGFYLAVTLFVTSLLMGLFFKQNLRRLIVLVVIGIVLALLGNVPRIMLLAMSVAYWGDAVFKFWHGPVGGQIFSSILLTIYYYIAMAIIKYRPSKALNQTGT